jgi:predicted permease
MSALLLLVACLVLGVLVARIANPPATLPQGLNWWVINVALSALILHLIPTLQFDWQFWFLSVSQWLVFLGAWAVFATLGRALHWSRARIGALTLVGRARQYRLHRLPDDRSAAGSRRGEARAGRRSTRLFSRARDRWNDRRRALFGQEREREGSQSQSAYFSAVPIALFSVGLQFRLQFQRGQGAALLLALSWKLLLAPLVVWLAGLAIGVSDVILTIAVLESAMAPMISAAILAEQNDLEPQLANTVLGIGIVLSLVTVPLADYLLRL